MKVVILCGGKGARLREQTESIPKPLIEIGDRPILWHIMKIYAVCGFNDFILCLGYKAQAIREYFKEYLNHDRESWKITFVDTGEETNTGGRIKRIEPYIKEDSFMVTYGDGLIDLDIRRLAEFHRSHGKIGTITAANPPLPFGLLDVDADDRVSRFMEKPFLDRWINGGFFVFRREFFGYMDEDNALEHAPLERLAGEGELMAFRHKGYWKCMDTYKDTVSLNELWASGKAPWKIW